MAKPTTTHVIEIQTGIGEPSFVPLTLGQELQPISVGKRGMWRIESARVLDVHAFVYFDGKTLFLQSADVSSAARVDGYPVGDAWTELHAPCTIELGSAKLRFRSLIVSFAADAASDMEDQAATRAMDRPLVDLSAGARGSSKPPPPRPPRATGGPSARGTKPASAPRPAAGVPAPSARARGAPAASTADELPTFPKGERPFKPGAFATQASSEDSTRVAPLEPTGSHPNLGGHASPRPAAGRSIEDDPPTRMEGSGRLPRDGVGSTRTEPSGQPIAKTSPPSGPSFAPPPMMDGGPTTARGGPIVPGMPGGPTHPGMPPMMMGPPVPGAPAPYGGGGPGLYGSAPPGPYGSAPPGPYIGAPPAPYGGASATEPAIGQYLAKYKDLSLPKRILVFLAPFCLISSAYLLLFDDDDDASPPAPVTMSDAGIEASVAASASSDPSTDDVVDSSATVALVEGAQTVPSQPSCPPGFVPYSTAIDGVIPCVPKESEAIDADAPQNVAGSSTPVVPTASVASTRAPGSNKTLERQAVDALAVNDFARAAALYEQLDRASPNRTYAEAARILRAKADAGAY